MAEIKKRWSGLEVSKKILKILLILFRFDCINRCKTK